MQQKRWMAIAMGLVCLLVVGILMYRERNPYEFAGEAKDGSYDMPVPQTSIQIQINALAEVDSKSGRCNLMVGNPAQNDNDVFITLTLDESQEIIYQSPVLKPGERLVYVNLDAVPEHGSWAATAEFAVLEPQSERVIGAADAGIVITVK